MSDTKDRVGILILNDSMTYAFIGKAPNKSNTNGWDLPKGHIDVTEKDDLLGALARELKEETGHDIEEIEDISKLDIFSYQYKNDFTLFVGYVQDCQMDSFQSKAQCASFFEWFGKRLPEFSEYSWVAIPDLKNYLYKNLWLKIVEPALRRLDIE